jgi:hypothetical protein
VLVILEHKGGAVRPWHDTSERALGRGEIGSQVGHGISGGRPPGLVAESLPGR